MKIVEFFSSEKQDTPPFNVVDDLTIFMRNDPMFYRKTFFPAMADVSDKLERGESVDPIIVLRPVVDKGINSYCKKFMIKKRPEDIFSDDDRKLAMQKIYSEEMPYIKKGGYKVTK